MVFGTWFEHQEFKRALVFSAVALSNGSWVIDRGLKLNFSVLATHYSRRDSRYYEYESCSYAPAAFLSIGMSNTSLRLVFDGESVQIDITMKL